MLGEKKQYYFISCLLYFDTHFKSSKIVQEIIYHEIKITNNCNVNEQSIHSIH